MFVLIAAENTVNYVTCMLTNFCFFVNSIFYLCSISGQHYRLNMQHAHEPVNSFTLNIWLAWAHHDHIHESMISHSLDMCNIIILEVETFINKFKKNRHCI